MATKQAQIMKNSSQALNIDKSIDIGARGISFISALAINGKTLKEDFIMQCQVFGLEFIDPTSTVNM